MRRFPTLMATCCAVLAVGVTAWLHPVPRLVWNASASVPIGLYVIGPTGAIKVGDLVLVQPPEPLASLMDDRRYLPIGVPMLKHIAALAGQRVCRIGETVTVDGHLTAQVKAADRAGRVLPSWQGCRHLAPGEVFLLNPEAEGSFDGRYFGVLPSSTVLGIARPIWITRDAVS